MDPKQEGQPATASEVDSRPSARPVTLGKLATVKLTPAQLAERIQADAEEEARKAEARRPKSGPNAVAPPSASPAGSGLHVRPPGVGPPNASPSGLPARPAAASPPVYAAVPAPAVSAPAPAAPSGPAAAFRPAQGPLLAQLFEAALPLLGAEGKHLAALGALCVKVGKKLNVPAEGLELLPIAIEALYLAAQLDRRGPYAPPELATLQKLLGATWAELGPLVEPSAKGGMSRSRFSRMDAAAVAVTIYYFNHTRNPAAPDKVGRAALNTLKTQGWIPLDAIDALASEIG